MPDFLHSPNDLLLALLFASTLALGACLWLVWSNMRQLARRERKMVRETEDYVHQQLGALNDKLAGELTRLRREAENTERTLEAAMRRRLDELQGLIESLRILEAKLQARLAATQAEQPSDVMAKETRAGFSVIARPPKPGSRENPG